MNKIIYEVAEITVAYKSLGELTTRNKITNSDVAFQAVRQGYDMSTIALQEQFVVLYLNRANFVLGLYKSSKGGITGTIADVRLILSVALKIAATGIIISHNHPSGSIEPSKTDLALTQKVKEAAGFMDILLLDHIIIDDKAEKYYSFADES